MSAVVTDSSSITPEQAAEEHSLFVALLADTFMVAGLVVVGILGGSLTIIAESLRAGLMMSTEVFAFILMRRMHRGQLENLDFGTGKIEQVASFLIGAGMMIGAGWILSGAVELLQGGRAESTPIWLAVGAILGSINFVINLITWDGMRRTLRAESSLVMEAQYKARTVKLLASGFVQVTLTVAAVSPDAGVVATADAIGSIFLVAFIAVSAFGILRHCIPDLLDRSAGSDVSDIVDRALALHRDDFDRMERLRSRRSGRVVFIEVTLAFDESLSLSEVNRRIARVRQSVQAKVEHGDISILASSSQQHTAEA